MSGSERYSPPIYCAPPATLHAPHGASVDVCLWLLHEDRRRARHTFGKFAQGPQEYSADVKARFSYANLEEDGSITLVMDHRPIYPPRLGKPVDVKAEPREIQQAIAAGVMEYNADGVLVWKTGAIPL